MFKFIFKINDYYVNGNLLKNFINYNKLIYNNLLEVHKVFGTYFFNYYKTDVINRNSKIMHNAALLYLKNIKNF